MLLYMSPHSPEERMGGLSNEEMHKMMEPWMTWKEKVGDALIDFGTPLIKGTHTGKGKHDKGEYQVTGYSIIQAESSDKVKEMLSTHPYATMDDSCIEILEMMPV